MNTQWFHLLQMAEAQKDESEEQQDTDLNSSMELSQVGLLIVLYTVKKVI